MTAKGPRVVHIDREGLTEGELKTLEQFLTFVTETCAKAMSETDPAPPKGTTIH
jgi:hypothetical protein